MRLLAAALVFAFTAGVLSAQPTFGLKAGLNVATMSGFDEFEDSDSIDKMPRLGAVGGAWVHYGFGPSVGVQAEVLYSQKGVRFEQDFGEVKGGDGGTAALDFDVDYVEIPILVKFMPDVNPTLDLGLYAGPSIALKVSETITERFGDEEDVYDGDDFFDSSDVGVAVGADVASGPFGVDLRYTFGLLSVETEQFFEKQGGSEFSDIKNGVFSATFMYRFGQ